MAELQAGVRELKTQLSKYLRQVKAGQTVVITEHGRAVARIVPAGQTLDDKLQAMVAAGLAEWNGKRLKSARPAARVKPGHSVADIILEDRI
jgi:prevent-host-death family protein